MRQSPKTSRPPESRLTPGMIAWGIAACLVLAGLSFTIGLLYMQPRADSQASLESNLPSQSSQEQEKEESRPVPKVDVEITEHGEDGVKVEQPEDGGNTTVTVTLPPSSEQKTSDAKPAQDASAPAQPSSPQPVEKPSQEGPADSSGGQAYRIQMGTFASADNAEALVRNLREHGRRADIKPVRLQDRTLYRVQLSDLSRSRDDAEKTADALSSEGFPASVFTENKPE